MEDENSDKVINQLSRLFILLSQSLQRLGLVETILEVLDRRIAQLPVLTTSTVFLILEMEVTAQIGDDSMLLLMNFETQFVIVEDIFVSFRHQ